MYRLDGQECAIVKALIKNPRISDNRLGEEMDIPVRTVNRKRKKLEQAGIISYMTRVNMLPSGTGHFPVQHLFIIQFKLGVTVSQIVKEIQHEPNVITIFTQLIFESYIADVDGHTSLIMVVDGQSEADIVERFQGYIIPSLQKNHGRDSIEKVSTIRLLEPIRMLKNYLPSVNMKDGRLRKEWKLDSIYIGEEPGREEAKLRVPAGKHH
jgi:DNA-binding Lrp family transcriptional regulator